MSKEKFEKLKEREIRDIEQIILFNIEDFMIYKTYNDKTEALESVKGWIETREEIYNLEYNIESYNYLKSYYEDRGFDIEDLNDAFDGLLGEENIVVILIKI